MTVSALTRPPTPLGHIERTTRMAPGLIEDFLAVYRAAFAPLEKLAPARQAYDDDEFRHEMTDERIMKLIAWDNDGVACGMAFIATDLSVVPWISVPYYAHRFPEHYARGAVFYIGAMLVRPEKQGGPWAKELIDEIVRFVGEHRAVGCFDCCGFNADVVKLPDTIARATHRLTYAESAELDTQRYYAHTVAGLR